MTRSPNVPNANNGRTVHQEKYRRCLPYSIRMGARSEEHTSELQSRGHLVCRLLLEYSFVLPALHSFPTRRSSDLPWASPVELDTSHPLFHCFYDIDEIIQVTNDSIAKCPECEQWENGPSGKIPKVFAIFDQDGRISILMAWNTDLGDGLEWADDPSYPASYSTYAFKFLTNAIVYTMTH